MKKILTIKSGGASATALIKALLAKTTVSAKALDKMVGSVDDVINAAFLFAMQPRHNAHMARVGRLRGASFPVSLSLARAILGFQPFI